jgi:preprotein translocase subunit SecD
VIIGLALAAILVTHISLFNFKRGGEGPVGLTLGLDLQGGSYLVFEATEPDVTEDDMKVAANTIERRVNAFGLTEPLVQRMGANRIMVQLPGVANVEDAKQLIGQTAKLEFKERTCTGPETAPCSTWEDKEIGLTGDDLARAYPGQHSTTGAPIINIQFNSRGTSIFADLTKRIAGINTKQIAIILDGDELLSPVVKTPILSGTGFIEGPSTSPFASDEVQRISIQLNSGRLRVPLKLIQETTVDATLGSESLAKSLEAGLVGLGLTLLFLIAYYRMSGVVAGLALIVYAVITLAVFKLLPVTLTLPGIAGFIVSVGMAVDANVLIFERMKEELRTGRTLTSAIEAGFRRAWLAIRDSNLTTLLTCAILYWFGAQLGASLVQGFAVTLFLGVILSMFTALFVSQTLLQIMSLTPLGKRPGWFTPERLRISAQAVKGS